MFQNNAFRFQWMNESALETKNNQLILSSAPHSDFFIDPAGIMSKCNAPFYYTDISGDFIVSAKVEHDFISVYDACALMVYADDRHWAKLCFENTDFNTHAVVSVITKETSDDANGPNLADKSVWLQIAKKGNVIAMHYSTDGKKYDMIRIFEFPYADPLKVGMVAQSPTGMGGEMNFYDFSITSATVQNIRSGK